MIFFLNSLFFSVLQPPLIRIIELCHESPVIVYFAFVTEFYVIFAAKMLPDKFLKIISCSCIFAIVVLPHGKFNSGHFMKSNFLALDRYLRRYSEKTKKSAARGFSFASNRKSLPTIVLKTQGSYYAGDNVSVVKCSTFVDNIWKFRLS